MSDESRREGWHDRRFGRISGLELSRLLTLFNDIWDERAEFGARYDDPEMWAKAIGKLAEIPNWVALYELDLLRLIGELITHSGLADDFVRAASSGTGGLIDLVQQLPDTPPPNLTALPAAMAMVGNLEAIALYSRSINDMVKAAKAGDLSALGDAASIDAYVLSFPFFLAGMRFDQLSNRTDFTKEVLRTVCGPHRRRYEYSTLRWAEYLLRDQGAFESCSREELYELIVVHLRLYDPTGAKRDPKAALFTLFRSWQQQAGIQNPRFGFSAKGK